MPNKESEEMVSLAKYEALKRRWTNVFEEQGERYLEDQKRTELLAKTGLQTEREKYVVLYEKYSVLLERHVALQEKEREHLEECMAGF